MISPEQITGLILAGGRAQRMGGVDKGLISFHNKPLIESTIAQLKNQVGPILINANRNITKYAGYGHPVIMDETPDFSGPLAGFSAGLKVCKTTYLLTTPCDSPLLPIDLGTKLAAEMNRGDFQLVYASSSESDGKVWAQPVFCLMRSNLQESLKTFLQKGDLKIDRWFKEIRSSTVVFNDAQAFANVNTPEELKALEEASV
ncbi:molybdenum cofactor guanylyltransferase [Polynucleobacter sp. MG-5-Ahmo-C2]|jgi:molybdopterin-guanine dinucleotide biosynthesis protein A|uniref:molybdenum cofactor guanylyltransferase MobA n=1 Tax=unclassified Polynucleobacter TaxID=2640945 RepID=UPI001BFDB1B1|nr:MULTISPECIES: molybdenum cofactor guanylyltransferase MobA [unclassified Polynucleobacter]QWD72797.1 molybdenum cofactor guanylyltransferase [Polynucleobacter sp. UB-Raua-W9]QWD98897.1 molybdenum cofactor guanylyltransferase [Polynucleobacter sp. MG-5-Ahmo-C2]